MNERSKHINVRYHVIVDNIRKGIIRVFYVPTKDIVADIMKKLLAKAPFQHLPAKMDMDC